MSDRQIRIPIRYFGRDADRHELDLVSLGQSLQGAGRIIDIAASMVIPSAQKEFSYRILAGEARPECFEITAILATLQPFLPVVVGGSKKAVEGLVNYGIARLTKKPDATSHALDVAQAALAEMGMTARAAIEAVRAMDEVPRTAARKFMAPIGRTCDQAMIGNKTEGAIPFDISDRDTLEAEPIEIGPLTEYLIQITELDVINKTCKFSMDGENSPRRYVGTITDPSVAIPKNQYASSLAESRWLKVSAKAELSEGHVTRLYISDSLGTSS